MNIYAPKLLLPATALLSSQSLRALNSGRSSLIPNPGRDLLERRTHKRDDLIPRKFVTHSGNKPPALEELGIRSAIDNLDHIRDVTHTDARLLKIILPHCTLGQTL
ncbi:hypothetical protein R1flu_006319 [Riccia fluitans]|uniref:Uncharacterized protein n=1 Tax=Riccia fluitans TaxID=41844 RepID=A0ABD1YWI5_9MARC